MNRRIAGPQRAAALGVALGAIALALAGCAPAVVAARLTGTPAISISVPLSNVGCTLNDVCVAAGTSSDTVGPSAVGEFRTPKGKWLNLALPTSPSPLLVASACAGTLCLLGGSSPGHDLLWVFDARDHALSMGTPPEGGIGVDALACSELACALVDTGVHGVLRFTISTDGGATWTVPTVMAWASRDAVTTLSCGTIFDCAMGVLTPHHRFILYVTADGGVTWSARATPTAWTTLTSLTCEGSRCVALASTATSSKLVRTKNFALTWSVRTLAHGANALACTTTACIVVGQRANDEPWLTTVSGGVSARAALRYVPTPLLGVACGSKICAAIGVTTLVSVPLPQ